MAVAVTSANKYLASGVFQLSFAINNTGNAFCFYVNNDYDALGNTYVITTTCNGSTLTPDFNVKSEENYLYNYLGYHKLNSNGTNNIVITAAPDPIYPLIPTAFVAKVICLSGVNALTSVNNVEGSQVISTSGNQTYPLTITSQSNDLVISYVDGNSYGGYVYGMSGTSTSTPFWYSQTAGTSPNVTVTATIYWDADLDSYAGYFIPAWSFAPPYVPPPPVTTKPQVIGPQIGVWTSSRL